MSEDKKDNTEEIVSKEINEILAKHGFVLRPVLTIAGNQLVHTVHIAKKPNDIIKPAKPKDK